MRDYGDDFNLAHIEPSSQIYGPGKRFVIWFQGCSLACDGCWNQDMWSFKVKDLLPREFLLNQILGTPDIQGVTFLGGEPLHQAENLWWLICQIRKESNLTIFLFTGYEQEELERFNYLSSIHELCDMAAIGRYQSEDRNINQQWIGSDNQVIIYPSQSREIVQSENTNQVEIIIEEDESVRVLGFPDDSLIDALTITE